MSSPIPAPTDRTRVLRKPDRAHYDRETVAAILDDAIVAHVGFLRDGVPVVIPTVAARDGDVVYLHGAGGNTMLRSIEGAALCVTATLVDGLVLARSAFHHSINYRSVVVFGRGAAVDDPDEKRRAFKALTEKIAPGQWDHARRPTEKEMATTRVVRVPLAEASAKIRTGPPIDDDEDIAAGIWGGVLPLRLAAGDPRADAHVDPGAPVPDHITRLAAAN